MRLDDAASWAKLKANIAEEKSAYLQNRLRTPEWELGKSTPHDLTEGDLSGLPGSPGTACGAVFKVLSTDDFSLFPHGAILVARTTNPAWTPLFYKASAIVTESGGPLSHGAVTAREIGLPAVMSVRGVLETLENGQMITVDGTNGRVIV